MDGGRLRFHLWPFSHVQLPHLMSTYPYAEIGKTVVSVVHGGD
jgi:hypothetical protein